MMRTSGLFLLGCYFNMVHSICFTDETCFSDPMLHIVSTVEQREQAVKETVERLNPYFDADKCVNQLRERAAEHPVLDVADSELQDFVAVSGYTASTQGLNDNLRLDPSSASIKANAIAIASGLNRLRAYDNDNAFPQQLVYRGVALPNETYRDWRDGQQSLFTRSFMSTTNALATARMFTVLDNSSKWWVESTTRIVMVGYVCTAANVSFLAYYPFSAGQEEHLLSPGSTVEMLQWEQAVECFSDGAWAQSYSLMYFVERTPTSTTCSAIPKEQALLELKAAYKEQYRALPSDFPRVSYCDPEGGGDGHPAGEL